MSQLPMFMPQSDWQPPSSLPDLKTKRILAIDTETRDPHLLDKGPGFIRGDADLRGFSVATESDSWFFPLRYPEDNYHDPGAALLWLKDLCKQDNDKVFHNALYDIEALDSEGIVVNGRWHDTMAYEALFAESASVSLDATAHRRLGKTKDEVILQEAAASYGVDPKAEMYLLPARYVGPYGEQDTRLLPALLESQLNQSRETNMGRVLDIESRLLRVVWAMRKQGVAVDLEETHRLDDKWKGIFKEHIAELQSHIPFEVDIWGSKSLQQVCDHLKIEIQRTPKGNPSFTNDWFESHPHSALQAIAYARKVDKARRDFIKGQILNFEVNGRIHAQFHATRRDDGGTRSGRFASSKPNLQQAPERDPIFGRAIRRLYIPDEGASWGKFDYSSQEPRITLHLANIAGIESAGNFVREYQRDPGFCQHTYAAGVLGVKRKACKDINLGLTYGMGVPKLSYKLGVDIDEAWRLRREYEAALPFVGDVADYYTDMAASQGYIQTILGRRSYFTGADEAFTYKGLNRAVQGSGADLMKTAMVLVYEDMGMTPLLTVHDETDYNIYEEEHAYQIVEIMENAIPMTVPQYVEPELGPSWGELYELK
jgi:DNA polymerase I-like protein with 3'-5' exonuclease and polymerase domains